MPEQTIQTGTRPAQPSKAFYEQVVKAIPLIADLEGDLVNLHSARVAIIASSLASRILETNERTVFIAGLYHDVGANGSSVHPARVLQVKGQIENVWLKMHPIRAHHAMSKSRELAYSAQIVLEHHEWHDGRGYPLGRRANSVMPEAQIIRIVDSFDQLMMHTGSSANAFAALEENAGSEFDRDLFELFEKHFDEIRGEEYWESSDRTIAELLEHYARWSLQKPQQAAGALTILFDLKKKSLRHHTERTLRLALAACGKSGSMGCELIARVAHVHELYTTYEPFRGATPGGIARREALAFFPLVEEAFMELEQDPWVAEMTLAACQLDQALTVSGEPVNAQTVDRALALLAGKVSPETLLLLSKGAEMVRQQGVCT